jgi:Tfp pilus assembly protein PilP
MRVGMNEGKILEISKDSVTIREMIRDWRGELKPEDTVIKLREEEEE